MKARVTEDRRGITLVFIVENSKFSLKMMSNISFLIKLSIQSLIAFRRSQISVIQVVLVSSHFVACANFINDDLLVRHHITLKSDSLDLLIII